MHNTVHYYRLVGCKVLAVACAGALLSTLGARSVATLPSQPDPIATLEGCVTTPNNRPCCNKKFLVATDLLKLSVATENSLPRQRRIGPLSQHRFHVATQGLPALSKPTVTLPTVRPSAQRALSRQRTPYRNLGLSIPAPTLPRHRNPIVT